MDGGVGRVADAVEKAVDAADAADAATRASCARFLAADLAEDLDRQLPLLPGSEVLDQLDVPTKQMVREAIVAFAGLEEVAVCEMPANNLTLVYGKASGEARQ